MGLGDWIMATSQVREINERTGQKVVVVDRLNRPRWSEVFENNPRISRVQTGNCQRLLNAGGARPYIRHKTDSHWAWKRWDIKPGEIFLSDPEKLFAISYVGKVLIEPNTKVVDGNKAWIWDRWQAVVDSMNLDWIQIGPPGSRRLSNVTFVETNVRRAFAVLGACKLFVGTEGALHHAAAALKTPAVVLWSEFISPLYTGYPTQRNLRTTINTCGARLPCSSCKQSMEDISVDNVIEAIRKELSNENASKNMAA